MKIQSLERCMKEYNRNEGYRPRKKVSYIIIYKILYVHIYIYIYIQGGEKVPGHLNNF